MTSSIMIRFRKTLLTTTSAFAVLAAASAAHATQPLEDFLTKAKSQSFDSREQEATVIQRDAEAEAALGRLIPALLARGTYTRNQYEVAIATGPQAPAITIQPQNQWDGLVELDVPIIDAGSYYRYRASKAVSRATKEQKASTDIDVARNVTRVYYQLIGGYALSAAAEKSLALSESNLRDVEVRRSAGTATELDRERARANVERAKQDLSDAQLVTTLAGRNLETLSGLAPTAHDNQPPSDDLHEESPMERWLTLAGETPADRAAREQTAAAFENKKAATAALLPTLTAVGQERFTNATSFSGKTSTYALQVVLQWRLDYTLVKTTEAQSAARQVAGIREERTRRSISDAIFEAHRRVEANIVKSRSARAQQQAAAHAAELAQDRYTAGAATQLDVTQAQRDAFQADATRIQADADLVFARASLRLAAGLAPNDRRNP